MKSILNKKATYNYELIDKFEAGIVLTGSEIKSIRDGRVQIKEAHGITRNGEVFILNMHISKYAQDTTGAHDPIRTRKLLLNKTQINKIIRQKKAENLTLVPTKLYIKKGFAKLELWTAKGKKKHDKRQTIASREADRRSRRMEKYQK